MVFNRTYFAFAAFLFVTEVLIALFVNDGIIRPYVGDFLVVMLIYCAVKTFFNLPPLTVAAGTLLFAYLLETLQYFQVVTKLGLQHNKLARTVIGIGFDWLDLVAYTLGILVVLFLEKRWLKSSRG